MKPQIPVELEILYNVMRKMKAENKAVLFITHDLPELLMLRSDEQ